MFVWSAIESAGRFIWWLEALPVLIGVPAMVWLYARFRMIPMALSVVFVGSVMMLVGAHYTFADVPLGHWLADMLGWTRNPYDRLGHVVQGVILAVLARELLIRHGGVCNPKLASGLAVAVALAISASCELVECRVALANGESASAFLGTQGDIWDPQWDMTGAIGVQLLLGRLDDRQIASAEQPPGVGSVGHGALGHAAGQD